MNKNNNLKPTEIDIYNSAPEGVDPTVWVIANGSLNPTAQPHQVSLSMNSKIDEVGRKADSDASIASIWNDRDAYDDAIRTYEDLYPQIEAWRERGIEATKIYRETAKQHGRLKAGLGRRVVGSIGAAASALGVVGSLAIPMYDLSVPLKDDSILPRNSTTDIAPDWLDPFVPSGLTDRGIVRTKVEVIPIQVPADVQINNDSADTRPGEPSENRFKIVVRTDAALASAQNEYSPDFELTGSEQTSNAAAAELFVDELTLVLQAGGTVESMSVTGNASDEAGGEETGIGIRNPENESLAGKRAEAGERSLDEEIVEAGIAGVLPDAQLLAVENILTAEQMQLLQEVGDNLGMSRKALINRYLQGEVELSDAQAEVMQELIDAARGVTYEAEVAIPEEVADSNGDIFIEDDGSYDDEESSRTEPNTSIGLRTETVISESDEIRHYLSSNREFFATILAANPFVIGSLFALLPPIRMTDRLARRRARKELESQGFTVPGPRKIAKHINNN